MTYLVAEVYKVLNRNNKVKEVLFSTHKRSTQVKVVKVLPIISKVNYFYTHYTHTLRNEV